MRVGYAYVFLLCLFKIQISLAGYAACGSNDPEITAEAGVEDHITVHVTRLLELRNKEHGWENTPEIITAIQLSRQEAFTNFDGTVQRLEEELRTEATSMTLGKFAQYVVAAKAVCKNVIDFGGMNLINELQRRLNNEFNYDEVQQTLPRDGWYGFYLAFGAYCILNGSSPSDTHLQSILNSQNQDGSFDHTHSVDHTAQAMFGLICISRSGTLSNTFQAKVEAALNLASEFLISKVTTERDSVWIADEYSSPAGVLAIKEHSQWSSEAWRCTLIMRSLNHPHDEKEGESAIAQRLLALKGVSVLKLVDGNYQCQTAEGEITEDVGDNSPPNRQQIFSCESDDDTHSNFIFAPTLIDVHISIHPNALSQVETRRSVVEHITLTDVKKGKTLLQLMANAQCRGLLTFKTATTAWGEYITAINGIEANSENKEYWAVLNNGESLMVGAAQFKPSHSDRVSFKLMKWQ